jgi:hypothetical protein
MGPANPGKAEREAAGQFDHARAQRVPGGTALMASVAGSNQSQTLRGCREGSFVLGV